MFSGLKNMGNIIQQAKEMKAKMAKIQEELKKMTFTEVSHNNDVKVTVTGELEIVEVTINPLILKPEKVKDIEKALKETINKALKQSKDTASKQLSSIAGDLKIPGLT